MAMTALITGCNRGPVEVAPPRIHYGEHECDQCKMIISEERFAAGMVIHMADGRQRSAAFDDVNCMFDYQGELAHGDRVRGLFVHDIADNQWLDAQRATYLMSEALPTPMASGVAAAATRSSLEHLHREYGGSFITYEELQRRFTSNAAPATHQQEVHP